MFPVLVCRVRRFQGLFLKVRNSHQFLLQSLCAAGLAALDAAHRRCCQRVFRPRMFGITAA